MRRDILQNLRELRLPGIKEHYQEVLEQAETENMSYEDFLLRLLNYERDARASRRIERLLKEAKLPLGKTFAEFELNQLPVKVRQKIKTLRDGEFLERNENVLAFGKPGTGKTHVLAALGYELIQQGHKVYFTSCTNLVQQLLLAKKELQLPKVLKKFSKYDALIIDDIGYVQQSREEMEVLFTLLSERYETGSLLLSSNLPFSEWEKIFKDPMTAAAAIDRLVHHSIILEMNVNSYRNKQAKAKKEKNSNR